MAYRRLSHRCKVVLTFSVLPLLLAMCCILTSPPCAVSEGVKLYGGVSELIVLCQSAGITLSGNKLPATVLFVRLGSTALYAGISKGDKVLSAAVDNNVLTLKIERDKKSYAVRVPVTAAALRAASGATMEPKRSLSSNSDAGDADASVPRTLHEKLKRLAEHDIVVIIDRSGSMKTPDCPNGNSRWGWCRDQAVSFMQLGAEEIQTITLVTFSYDYKVYPNSDLNAVKQTFETVDPDGGTGTAAPLDDRLQDYFRRRDTQGGKCKPLLIAVITDGLPNLPGGPVQAKQQVENAIIDATRRMNNPGEVSITFLSIGDAFEGDAFLRDLDTGLLGNGARYDIVSTKSFQELERVGLMQALIDAIETKSSQSP